nr:MAG TPA: hypothetical protein [Caudoviricetes sp.]
MSIRFENACLWIIISKTNRFIVSYNSHSYLYSIFFIWKSMLD